MTSPRVRRAEARDADAIARLSGELGYPVDAGVMRQRIGPLLASETDVVLVAELPGHGIAGWIHGGERDWIETGRRGEILGLVVTAGARRRGVGLALVEAVEHWIRGRGLATITVRTNVTRAESHPFYEELGFTRLETQHVYHKHVPSDPEPERAP